MSYDVFFQGFNAGESSGSGAAEMRAILSPHVDRQEHSFLHISYGDGEADVYLGDDGMMANHITGREPWDLLLRGAQAANWVIMPVDAPVFLTAPGQREQLPEGLGDVAVDVESGAELVSLIEGNAS